MEDNAETIINEDLILECLKSQSLWLNESDDQRPDAECLKLRELLAEEVLDITLTTILDFSFRNIYEIAHLQGFERLVKLKLDNNKIRKIENVDHLVNLEWLDLSFNQIRKIDGLGTLSKLRTLVLSSNRVDAIENLEGSPDLEILSLADNRITNLAEVEALRTFKNLKVLNLKGNPVVDVEDFHNTAYAFLNLDFLDYTRVSLEDKVLAREEKTEYINAIQQREAKKLDAQHALEKKLDRDRVLKAANIFGVETIFDDMIKDDGEMHRLQLLPEFAQLLKTFEDRVGPLTSRYVTAVLATQKEKERQEELFKYSYNKLCEASETESRKLVEAFEPDYEPQTSDAEKNILVDQLEFGLMEIEMHHVDQFAAMVDKYDDICDDVLRANVKEGEKYFAELGNAEDEHFKVLSEVVEKLLETAQEEGVQKIENKALDVDSLEKLQTLLDSKETTKQMLQGTHDNHISHISKIEDQVRDREESSKKEKIAKVTRYEHIRNRNRCSEIYDLTVRFRQDMKLPCPELEP